jgi:hypothetical protein
MRSPLIPAVAIGVGLIILLGYFLPLRQFVDLRLILLDWSVLLAAVAGLIAIIGLIMSHAKRIIQSKKFDLYSPVLILAFLATFIAGMLVGPSNPQFEKVVTHIQLPVEASLLGILTISLAVAAFKFFQYRKGWASSIFLVSVIVFLLMNSWLLTFGQNIPVINELLSALKILPLAGARGILLGIALGGLATGIRILIGADRPYSG